MREQSVPCAICQRDTFHDSAVCERGECRLLLAHSERRIAARLADRSRFSGTGAGVPPAPAPLFSAGRVRVPPLLARLAGPSDETETP